MKQKHISKTLQESSKNSQVKLMNFNNYSLQKTNEKRSESKHRRNKKMVHPIKKHKSGQIETAVWENEREVNGNIVSFKTVSLRKSWHDKEKDLWRDATINLRRNDLQKAILVLQKAQEDLLLQQQDEGDDDDE
jgi:hypothetical protein